jgi:hypothetical protein
MKATERGSIQLQKKMKAPGREKGEARAVAVGFNFLLKFSYWLGENYGTKTGQKVRRGQPV